MGPAEILRFTKRLELSKDLAEVGFTGAFVSCDLRVFFLISGLLWQTEGAFEMEFGGGAVVDFLDGLGAEEA